MIEKITVHRVDLSEEWVDARADFYIANHEREFKVVRLSTYAHT